VSFTPFGAQISRPLVMGRTGTVVAGHHLAAQAGLDLLRAGGTAIDAAIAAAAALAVLKPDACGLGSDLFLLYADGKTGETFALNASGTAPQSATPAAFGGAIPELGLRASAVPGAISGWENALERFGRKKLADVLAPAIALARRGMPVSQLFASTLARSGALMKQFPATGAIFWPNGKAPGAGDVLVQADAARILEGIAKHGAASFYDGEFARALDAYSRETGAFLRATDLKAYRSEWRDPVRVAYRGVELIAQPPVSVGLVVLECLKILESTAIASYADASADFIHTHVEAMKLAGADLRGHLADPAFTSQSPIAQLLDPSYTERRGREIDPARAQTFGASTLGGKPPSDTSYVAVIDGEGNAVSMLQSVFAVFGSGEVVPGTGVLMNNRMTGFSLDPASLNVVAPGKKTLHTLNPHMIKRDGRVRVCLGTPGGPSQTFSNTLMIMRLIERGLDIQQTVEAPRWFVAPSGELHIESSVDAAVRDELAKRGHVLNVELPLFVTMGGAGIARINEYGVREGAADPRRESYAVAY
jgi:gamma-glutamyltranspeptidase / glutathione hydrolase